MNNWKEYLKNRIREENEYPHALVVDYRDVNTIVNIAIKQVLEQIEEAKLSELGNVIKKLKEEYK